MGLIKIVQSAAMYISAIFFMTQGETQLSILSLIAALLCDIAHIIAEKS